jgi:hypothetical protein
MKNLKEYCQDVLDDLHEKGAKISEEHGYLGNLWWEYLTDVQQKQYRTHCYLGKIGKFWKKEKHLITYKQRKAFLDTYFAFKEWTKEDYSNLPFLEKPQEGKWMAFYTPIPEPPIDSEWMDFFKPRFAKPSKEYAKFIVSPSGIVKYVYQDLIDANERINDALNPHEEIINSYPIEGECDDEIKNWE